MKVIHTQAVAGFSGKSGQGVFTPSGLQGVSYMRSYTYPKLTANNTLRGAEMANIKLIYNSVDNRYMEDLQTYAAEYANLNNYGNPNAKRANGSFAVFVKLMFAFHDMDPNHLDVATMDLSAIDTLWPALNTIATQVAAGLLPATPSSAILDGSWV